MASTSYIIQPEEKPQPRIYIVLHKCNEREWGVFEWWGTAFETLVEVGTREELTKKYGELEVK